jgi:hypothetical protein
LKWVVHTSDHHTHELGFLPQAAFDLAHTRGTLRVRHIGSEPIAYVLHGILKPETKIWQTYTAAELRLDDHADSLVRELLIDLSKAHAERVYCWVADDLEAIHFWEAIGFTRCGARNTSDEHKRPATRFQFRLPKGLAIDDDISARLARQRAAELIRAFGMTGAFERQVKREHRRRT